MAPKKIAKRQRAVRLAHAINSIEGVPVSRNAKDLSDAWARGEISGEQMKAALLASHKLLAARNGAARE